MNPSQFRQTRDSRYQQPGPPNASNRQLFQQNPLPAGYGYDPYAPQQPTPELAVSGYQEPRQYESPQRNIIQSSHQPNRDQETVQNLLGEQDTKHNIVDWVLYFLPLLFFLIALLVFSSLAYIKTKHENPIPAMNTLEQLENNLKLTPLYDIVNPTVAAHAVRHHLDHFSTNNMHDDAAAPTCPQGYEFINFGQWAGTEAGCICADQTVHSRAYCLVHKDCKFAKSFNPVDFKFWKNSQLCAKKVTKFYWKGSKPTCETDYLACGGDLCVQPIDKCPINSFNVLPATSQSNGALLLGAAAAPNAPQVRFTASTTGAATGDSPFLHFSATPGADATTAPCFNKAILPKFQSAKFYPLEVQPEKGCDDYSKFADGYLSTIDSFDVLDLHNQNGMDANFVNGVPYFGPTIVNTDTYQLQGVRRITIKVDAKCDNVNPDDMTTIRTRSQTVHNYTKFISIFAICVCVLMVLLAPVLFILKKKEFSKCSMIRFRQVILLNIIAIFVAILCIILGAVYFHQVDENNGLRQLHDSYDEYLKAQCFPDAGITKAIKTGNDFAKDSYDQTNSWVKFIFWVALIYLLILIACVVVQRISRIPLCINPWNRGQVSQS